MAESEKISQLPAASAAETTDEVPVNESGVTKKVTLAQVLSLFSASVVSTTGSPSSGKLAKFSGASSITNADLTGDVTTSGGLVATIASGVVSNAKLATMVAHTFKGNDTGSTAAPLDLTAAQLTAELNAVVGDSGSGGTKGLVPAPASGDAAAGKFLKADGTFAIPPGTSTPGGSDKQVQYNNNGAFGGISNGTTGFALVSNGASSVPSFQPVGASGGGALVLLGSQTASGSAALNFTSLITSTYDEYWLELVGIVPVDGDDLQFQVSTDNGSTYDTTTNHYAWAAGFAYWAGSGQVGTTNATGMIFRGSNTTYTSGGCCRASIIIRDPLSGSLNTTFDGRITINDATTRQIILNWSGEYKFTTAVTAFRLNMVAGSNLTSGTARLYGIAK